MAGLVTYDFRVHNAKQFYEQFGEDAPSVIYMFIGRVRSWTDDNSPPTPVDKLTYSQYDVWRSMLAMKRVSSSDVSHCCTRNNWSSGQVYDEYKANDATLANTDFIVVTNDYQVYKCLSNNRGASSTVKPTSTSNTAFDTADGYRWKYLYSISAARAVKFLSSTYMPVQTLESDDLSLQWDVQASAANGAIETVDITAVGASYPYNANTAQTGNTTTITLDSGASASNDTYNGCDVYIISGTGAGQKRTISDYVGATRVAIVSSVWSTAPDATSVYNVAPALNVYGDGSGFSGYLTMGAGTVNRVNILDPGSNYSWATANVTSGAGSGVSLVPMIPPVNGHGSDAVYETYARSVMAATVFEGSESNTVVTENDYRIVGLLVDPILSANGSIAEGTVYDMTTVLDYTSLVNTFEADEQIVGASSNATAWIAQLEGSLSLRVTDVTGAFANGETITGQSSSASATISGITQPDIERYKGHVLYIEHRAPVIRDANQSESSKIIVRF